MSDPTTNGVTGGSNSCEVSFYPQESSTTSALSPIDTPHGLAGDINYLKDFFVNAPKGDILGLARYINLLPQLLDRPGSSQEISFSAPLRKGVFLSELEVTDENTRIYANLTVKDGYPEGTLDFYPPIVQKNFKGTVDLPSNPLLGKSFLPLDVNVYQIKMVADADRNDPTKKSVRFVALVSHPLLIPVGAYLDVDVTELITRRYLGDENQMERIDFKMSRFVEMAMAHAQAHPFADVMMADPAGASFNIKATSDGTLPVYDGPYQYCTEGRNEACSSLQFHWDALAIGNSLTLRDIDAQVFVFPDPETGGFVVEIPSAAVGQVIQKLPGNPPELATTISNSRVENVILEIVPKDPNNLLAGMYLKKGRGTILASGVNVMQDIQVGSLGSGIEFEITGDENNNLSARLNSPGFILDKADLILAGAAAVHIDDAATFGLDAAVNLQDGVLSYQASMEQYLECTAFSGVFEDLGMATANATDLVCEDISLSSNNVFESHDVSINSCEGNLQGNARLFGDLPLEVSFDTSFSDFDAQLAMSLPQTPGAFPEIVLNSVDLPNFDFGLSAGLWGYTADVNVMDGSNALDGVDIPEGIHIKTVDGVLKAQINTIQVIELKGPEGTVKIDGQVVGTVDLVLVKTPGGLPKLLPVVGSLNLEMTHGTAVFVSALGVSTQLKGRVRISDDASGKITLMDSTSVTKPIPFKVNTDAAITLTQSKKNQTVNGKSVTVYDLPDGADLSFTTKLTEKHIGTLTTTGKLSISGLHAGKPEAKFELSTPFGGKRTIEIDDHTSVSLEGGGVFVKGDLNLVSTQIKLPNEVVINKEIPGPNGSVKITGTLKTNSVIDSTLQLKGGVPTRLDVKKGKPLKLEGTLIVQNLDASGKEISKGELEVSAESDYELVGTLKKGKVEITLNSPLTTLSGTLKNDVNLLGMIDVAPGAKFNIPFAGFKAVASFKPKGLDPAQWGLTATLTIPDVPSATTSIPKLALQTVTMQDIAAFTKTMAHGQEVELQYGPKGLSFRFLPGPDGTLPPFEFILSNCDQNPTGAVCAADHEGLNLSLKLTTQATDISGGPDPATGEYLFNLDGFTLNADIDGQAPMTEDKKLLLDQLNAKAKLLGMQLRINSQTGEVRLSMNPPQPTGVDYPPDDLKAWKKWSKNKIKDYQKQMNKNDHFAVLGDVPKGIPPGIVQRGRGKLYVDFKPRDKYEYAVNLNDFNGDFGPAVTALLGQVFADIVTYRESPNPPIPATVSEPMFYDPGQDALFLVDPSDQELMKLIEDGLGISGEDALELFQNRRIDMDVILDAPFFRDNQDAFPPDVVRGLVEASFNEKDSTTDTISNRAHRFFWTLKTVRDPGNLKKMIAFEKKFWSNKVRLVLPLLFDDPKYSGGAKKGDGVNITNYSYLPYSPEEVYEIVSRPQDYKNWFPWVTDSGTADDGSFTGTVVGKYDYQIEGEPISSGPVKGYSYHLKKSSKNDFDVYSGRFLLIPVTDPKSKKVGTILVHENSIDFKGTDASVYEGRDEDLSEYADPDRDVLDFSKNPFRTDMSKLMPDFPIKKMPTFWIDLPMVNNGIKREATPLSSPVAVFPFRSARLVSNLNYILFHGKKSSEVNINGPKHTKELTYAPDGVMPTSKPEEFMFLENIAKKGETPHYVLKLKVEDTDVKRVQGLLVSGLNIDEKEAEKMIKKKSKKIDDKIVWEGEIEVDYLMGLDFVKRAFDEKKDPTLRKEYEKLLAFFLNSGPSFAASRGERFLVFHEKLRERYDGLTDADGDGIREMDVFSFEDTRFVDWANIHHPTDTSDTTNTMTVGILPNDVSQEEYHAVLSRPDIFDEVLPEWFIKAEEVPCPDPKPDTFCVSTQLKVLSPDKGGSAEYLIEMPLKPDVHKGPWTFAGGKGFNTNEGEWGLFRCSDGTIDLRVGLLDTRFPGDADVGKKTALQVVAEFYTEIYRLAAEKAGKKPKKIKFEHDRNRDLFPIK